ncbi:polysaccharide deacetylase family protein [Longimicrobium sp.]|uniref:polysaccharide deacetylase family protein n=1 Tax=Longimicrobium sp. TaxID=2029185 RepID=UPI002E33DE68|nr:polysaccharide deacetylase family protein [Longimicrobium sp.]HEX6038650.1 polysaccharide deacetylase family protein [Longimicrobium sp.]
MSHAAPVAPFVEPPAAPARADRGALVISLDVELHWGVRDLTPADGPYRPNLVGERPAVHALLDLFAQYGIGATWAIVGFLFARSRGELERFSPGVRPAYAQAALDPYREPLGQGEDDDPLHFAPSLVDAVARAPGQEVATHTFSHYYCVEPGQGREAFAADLASAARIAAARGLALRSIVFPRNQHNPAYNALLRDAGITCYRGAQAGWMYRPAMESSAGPRVRAARLADAYVPLAGGETIPWAGIARGDGLCDVPASRFLRPYSPRMAPLEPLRLRRIRDGLRRAARRGELYHLWWHPHNFGTHLEQNVAFLRRVLDEFAALREAEGMQSLTMDQAASAARAAAGTP